MKSIPLSLSQVDIWTEQQAWPNSTHLNIGGLSKLKGKINHSLLEQALSKLVARHDALRMVVNENGQQHCIEQVSPQFLIKSFIGCKEPDFLARDWQQEWMKELFPSDVPAVRFALLVVSETDSYVILQCSHLVMDGWSVSQTIRKWSELYNALLNNTLNNIEENKNYQDYIEDSLKYKSGRSFQKDAEFWQQNLPVAPELIFDKKYLSDSSLQVSKAYLETCSVSRSFMNDLSSLVKKHDCTLVHGLLAILTIYLAKAYNREQLIIGVPVLNRSGNKYKSTLGMFVGVLPLQVDIPKATTALDLIKQISKKLTQAYRYSKFPLSEQFKRLKLIENNRERLFDVLFSYEKFDFDCAFGDAQIIETKQTFSGFTRYPLALSLGEFLSTEDAEIVIEGKQEYFSRAETQQVGQRFLEVGQGVLSQPDLDIQQLNIIPKQERKWLMDLNVNNYKRSNMTSCFDLILQQAQKHPSNIAVLWQNETLTFQDLIESSFGLAEALSNAGIKQGDIVGFSLEKGPEILVTILAVAQIGAAFLPVDTNIPVARLANIIEQANCQHLCVSQNNERFDDLPANFHYLSIESLLKNRKPSAAFNTNVNLDNTAYVIFTSGSTGQPKGVAVSQRALSLRLDWLSEHWRINASDRSLQATQVNFDPALIELLLTLTQGGSVAFPSASRTLPEEFPKLVEQYQATLMAFVPSTIRRFITGLPSHPTTTLRVCCSGGEVLSPQLANDFIKATGADLYNVYGPTEATIFATAWKVSNDSAKYKSLPIGKGLSDTDVFVLDDQQQLVPFGVKGEVYLGGTTLSQGYLTNEQLNKQQFFHVEDLNSGLLYKTGDYAWQSFDGVLHFCERNDRQIKLRGYRIELSEIENALNRMADVKVAAVKLGENNNQPILQAWIQGNNQNIDTRRLRSYLATQLPDYMIPANFFIIEQMPYSSSEKIDYSKLHTVEHVTASENNESTENISPVGFIETSLMDIWQQVLSSDQINVNDNFFDIGGDSLSAVIMLSKVEQEFSVRLPLHQLIDNPTIFHLAECLESQLKISNILLSLSDNVIDKNLYIAASGNGDVLRFKSLANALDGVCNVHMLQPPSGDQVQNIMQLAELYARKIASRNQAEVYIAGFSVGGIVAVETAKLLQNKGVTVKELFIVDTILIKAPIVVTLGWKFFNKMIKLHPNLSDKILPARFRAVMSDNGLLMQVTAMRAHKISCYSGNATLLKSSAFAWIQDFLVKKWKRVITGTLHEFQIETSHSHFFEPEKVDKLSDVLISRINNKKQEG